ncbi:hypothetical protein MIND_00309300 [Mycena indigotica]|uniref:Phospholipase D/nuclease n=1 Tax=Mycena indigotica TaxID=2126181 RepID=A0A8H6T4Q4_9AGAR|nr:uncharacterized protein MIND_00309300 [Mycena indigotica]KAF7309385.1 hypothetical protein MIND_00309300 [Mycena indigotica]
MHIQQTLLGSFLVSCAFAQDLSVPSSWRASFPSAKPSSSLDVSERISIAQKAIDAITPHFNTESSEFTGIGYWQSGNVFSALANKDKTTGTTTNQEFVINNLDAVFKKYAHYDKYGYAPFLRPLWWLISSHRYNDDALWWAQSAMYAYRAYQDQNMLAHAVDVWTHVTGYVVTPEQAESGKNPLKTITIKSTCNEKTMAGGVFWTTNPKDAGINSITTGLYTTLSAFLAEAFGTEEYSKAAILSATWMKNHQINANNIISDTTSADCSTGHGTYTYNSGKYIEGLSVLAAVTKDSSWTTLMTNIINAAVKSSAWQGSDGIITEGTSPNANSDGVGFKAIFIRGLHEAWYRNPSNSGLRTLIRSYGDVQYNALSDLAANGSTYSSNWHGPPQAFTSWGQLAALDVLPSTKNPVPADDSETEDDTDEEWHAKAITAKRQSKTHSARSPTTAAPNPHRPSPDTNNNEASTSAPVIVVHDSDSDSNSELIPRPRYASRPLPMKRLAKAKAGGTVFRLEKRAIATQGILKSIPDRAQLEAERLARQRKHFITREEGHGGEPEPKRPKTVSSHSPGPATATTTSMGYRRFRSGVVLPTLTMICDPRADGRQSITFSDVLGLSPNDPDATLELAIISSYTAAPIWLASFFASETPVIFVAETGSEELTVKMSHTSWVQTAPKMSQHACMHMKYLVLLYKSGRLRVVVSTANLIELDWTILENAVFIQDVYLKSDTSIPNSQGYQTENKFAKILEDVLQATNVTPALDIIRQQNPHLTLTAISDLSKRWNWSGVRAELVASIPGKYQGWKAIQKTGHPRLMCALKALGLNVDADSKSDISLAIECGGSSIAAYTTQWVNQFYRSASGNRSSLHKFMSLSDNKRKQSPYPAGVKILFPTFKHVLQTGEHGAGSLYCTRKKWEAKNFPRSAFRHLHSSAGPSLMHTKMIIASFGGEASDAAGWMYVGSHNFTPAAWGNLSGDDTSPVLNVNNFELGVVLPLQTPEELDHMSAWERPPKKYDTGDTPWFQDEARGSGGMQSLLNFLVPYSARM